MNHPFCDHPPKPRCRLCQIRGRVPFLPDMPAPAGWVAPADSPAERGAFPPPVKPRLSIQELAALRKRR